MDEIKYEDMNKEEKISLFKAMTPLGILKSFRDEDEIWDFINQENEWSPDPEIVKKYAGIIREEMEKDKDSYDPDANSFDLFGEETDHNEDQPVLKQVTIDTTEEDPEVLKEQIKGMVQKAMDSIIKESKNGST